MSSSPFFNAMATYNATTVDLTLTRYGFGSAPGETHNQQQVGAALAATSQRSMPGPGLRSVLARVCSPASMASSQAPAKPTAAPAG